MVRTKLVVHGQKYKIQTGLLPVLGLVLNKDYMYVWDRQATREWIAQLENRIEDIRYYMERTVEWCDANDVYSDRTVFACVVMTAVWVSHMRNEPISKQELFEMLGVEGWDTVDDAIYQFNSDYETFEHEELLELVVSSF